MIVDELTFAQLVARCIQLGLYTSVAKACEATPQALRDKLYPFEQTKEPAGES